MINKEEKLNGSLVSVEPDAKNTAHSGLSDDAEPDLEWLIKGMELKAHALAREGGQDDAINALFRAIAELEKPD